MIVAFRIDPVLAAALRLAAHPDEDVVVGPTVAATALREGFPRLVVQEAGEAGVDCRDGSGAVVPSLSVAPATVTTWRVAWLADGLRRPWPAYLARRIAPAVAERSRPLWVDRTLADLASAAGGPLPRPLAGVGRRVLEHPAAYAGLQGLEDLSGISAGALKARFRRRGLASPFAYLRWFRAIAAAHVLMEPTATVLTTAHRLGWTSSGNLFRHLHSTTGMVPSALRTGEARERLLIRFASELLTREALAAWESLDDLFLRQRA